MKKDLNNLFKRSRILALLLLSIFSINTFAQKVHTSYLWHMDQPVYWADKSKDKPESKQFVEESQRLKENGTNMYPGSAVPHPTNDLVEIFTKWDRVNAYQGAPRDAISSIKHHANAGAQLSISGGLLDNIQSLGSKNKWNYSMDWMNPYKEAISWKTSGGFPRLDVVGFSYDHAFSPFVSERALKRQILAHQYTANKYYGHISKGYWPAECSFTERIIKTLKECGIEWSVIANSHLARTLSDYTHPYNINGNIDAPNRADQVPAKGVNWYSAAIDGRGSVLAAPYCYQAHKAQYIDPATGKPYTIDVVPMCNYISYVDGYSGANVDLVSSKIAPYSDDSHPSIVLLAHDGDNAWGGGSSYYNEAVNGFTNAAANAGYEPVTIQQFLKDHPVPANDIVRVEDGGWVNAENDWGHPQFINWLWPLYTKDNKFNPDGWTEDARNWAVITATDNYVLMAEDLEGGALRSQYIVEGGAGATNAEKAWHFYFGGLNSGFMYYGKAEDMEVKPSMTGNIAIEYAQKVINAKPNIDNTAPSVFIPQRFPYNPGATGFGPTTGYKKVTNSKDFHVWTFAYDVSGLSSVTLKYRIDNDGWNPIESIDNDTYAGGSEVGPWQDIAMTRRPMAADPVDPELNFFIMPKEKADLCYAEITGQENVLIDYYVEAVDSKGNVSRSPIQHVYVGDATPPPPATLDVAWTPEKPTNANTIVITCKNATEASKLHWGVNGVGGVWKTPIAAYQPTGTKATTGVAVETPFKKVGDVWQVELGPFQDVAQAVSSINFVINHGAKWDNNGGSDYSISVSAVQAENPIGASFSRAMELNANYTFVSSDFGFTSSVGNTLKSILITSIPTYGVLKYGTTPVTVGQTITNPAQLVFSATGITSSDKLVTASFTYKLIDSKDLISSEYKATFNINNDKGGSIIPDTNITIAFKKPADWAQVNIWAWTGEGSGYLFPAWPGALMTDNGDGWFSYTFDESVDKVNVIFSNSGKNETISILNITSSTCFQPAGLMINKLHIQVPKDCPLSK